eukprot:CAMPEP_0197290186 /NCGR_PEP_ID=MMETSP0890-20130614/7433_1 /TAXON_ID=44058 ORGANISM="Aureoumbra lagunensis, Strain CCMP1510" /NCGR_SAMPLE_ID=MMETSP0890 /ASSEMBLY_ACC=CAM_ASM_000533 /LENGTH=269 /DNA_ID=CAMNT_0042762057 /DNA_START=39 /DNA_END=848 /DNA_ORIENTATION=+
MLCVVLFALLCDVMRAYAPTGWRPAVRSGIALRRGSLKNLNKKFSSQNVDHRILIRLNSETGKNEEEKVEEESFAKEEDVEEGTFSEENDVTNSVVFLEKKIDVLKNELLTIDSEINEAEARRAEEWAEWGPQIEQLRTEFDNVKKRESTARSSASSTERANVLREIFPVTDNFDLAFDYIKAETDGQKDIADRYAAIREDLSQVYDELGVVAIEEVGVPFDPELHTAAMFQPDPVHPEEHVATILQKGFKVLDIIVRPATVIVSSGTA